MNIQRRFPSWFWHESTEDPEADILGEWIAALTRSLERALERNCSTFSFKLKLGLMHCRKPLAVLASAEQNEQKVNRRTTLPSRTMLRDEQSCISNVATRYVATVSVMR